MCDDVFGNVAYTLVYVALGHLILGIVIGIWFAKRYMREMSLDQHWQRSKELTLLYQQEMMKSFHRTKVMIAQFENLKRNQRDDG